MAERPDLDAIEEWVAGSEIAASVFGQQNRTPEAAQGNARIRQVRALLTYCRELEAENKRLREGIEKGFFTNKQAILDWLI